MGIWIETERCDGCGRCIRACSYEAVALDAGTARFNERCTLCLACVAACRNQAIVTDITPPVVPDFSDWKGIWVIAEHADGEMASVTLELLGKARELAAVSNQEVSAVLLGYEIEPLADILAGHGAANVHLLDHEKLRTYDTLAYTAAIETLAAELKPDILLLGATLQGRDLAPRVSRRLGAGLTADCTELAIDPAEGILLQTRPAFGGNVMATIVNRFSRPQMATVRPGVMTALEPMHGQSTRVTRHKPVLPGLITPITLLETVRQKASENDITKAKVIVAGGRGVGDTNGFLILKGLADCLGGQVAGTRIAVEQGLIPPGSQVGQTGKTVRPEIYIACGISGAVQHAAGITGSRIIVAINTDPEAPIFSIADWGIIGDAMEIVPELIRQLS